MERKNLVHVQTFKEFCKGVHHQDYLTRLSVYYQLLVWCFCLLYYSLCSQNSIFLFKDSLPLFIIKRNRLNFMSLFWKMFCRKVTLHLRVDYVSVIMKKNIMIFDTGVHTIRQLVQKFEERSGVWENFTNAIPLIVFGSFKLKFLIFFSIFYN